MLHILWSMTSGGMPAALTRTGTGPGSSLWWTRLKQSAAVDFKSGRVLTVRQKYFLSFLTRAMKMNRRTVNAHRDEPP